MAKRKPKKKTGRKKAQKKPQEKIRKINIKVVGVGGGGNSIVSEIASKVQGVRFIAANTDAQPLNKLKRRMSTFQFGKDLTGGMGTGMDYSLGEEAAKKEERRIKRLFQGQDFCIFVSCLGGGTGSGATPVFTKISKELGNVNFGVFTLPFQFEGKKKAEIAKQSLVKLSPHLDGFCVIPNERIFQIVDKKTPLKKALSTINERFAESLEGLIVMIKRPGLINIDFADLRSILRGRGLAFLNKVECKKGAEEEIEKSISSPLYPYGIKGATGLLFNIAGGSSLGIKEIGEISSGLQRLVSRRAKIIFGISQQRDLRDKVTLTLLATGCQTKEDIFPKTKTTKKNSRKKVSEPLTKKRKKVKKKEEKKTKSVTVTKTALAEIKKEKREAKEVRRNALQIKKELEEKEKEMLEKERVWEIPALLRRKGQKI